MIDRAHALPIALNQRPHQFVHPETISFALAHRTPDEASFATLPAIQLAA
jgi:hypothetical protein